MIIVSGCDNTGKTSLVKHINEKFNIPLAERFPYLPPKSYSDWLDYYDFVNKTFCRNKQEVHDRMFIDEFVYGPVKRDGYALGIKRMADLSNLMLMAQPLYIYTWLPTENVLKTFNERGQYPTEGDVPKILHKYNQVLKEWPLNQLTNVARFNYLSDSNYSRIDCVVENYLSGGRI